MNRTIRKRGPFRGGPRRCAAGQATSAIRLFTVLLTTMCLAAPASANPERRSGWAKRGMVVCDSDVAARAGLGVLKAGGNAIDAAVATAFALSVSFPWAAPLGGGGFAVVHLADGRDLTLDFRETAPAAASRDMFLDVDGNVVPGMSLETLSGTGTPGTVDGLIRLAEDYGSKRIPRSALITTAIKAASEGVLLDHDGAVRLNARRQQLQRDPDAAKIFCRADSQLWSPGDRLQQGDLARTLEQIALKGRAGFYEGEVAEAIARTMRAGGGLITTDDLAAYRSRYRDPVRGRFRGCDVVSIGPPSSGGVFVIQLLQMAESMHLEELAWGSVPQIHLLTEMERRAFADRALLLGDPDFVDVPVARLIDPSYAAARVSSISRVRATPSAEVKAGISGSDSGSRMDSGFRMDSGSRMESDPATDLPKGETTHISVVDAEGNAVAMTVTLNDGFGCGRVAAGTGVLLNNEMDDFSAKPGAPNLFGLVGDEANAIAPGKRPLSSMSPVIVLREGRPVLVVGSPGGSRIITSVFQVILDVLAYGMPVAEAVAVPREHSQWLPDVLYYEPHGMAPEVSAGLEQLGHTVEPFPLGAIGR
ncbi:MAG: gamma-glutamyltransferase, partial [Candidatus Eisenbacteria bacterium]|nr:gamma-glutamyltransferase [Candidatus Eisenbacteria bacterium]